MVRTAQAVRPRGNGGSEGRDERMKGGVKGRPNEAEKRVGKNYLKSFAKGVDAFRSFLHNLVSPMHAV
jgi:hypothetical protein